MARVASLVMMLVVAVCSAFKAPVTRRDALRVTAAALVSPALPAFATKSKMKDAMVQADAVTKQQIAETTGLAAGSAGKGLRGTASSSFDSSTAHGIEHRASPLRVCSSVADNAQRPRPLPSLVSN